MFSGDKCHAYKSYVSSNESSLISKAACSEDNQVDKPCGVEVSTSGLSVWLNQSNDNVSIL